MATIPIRGTTTTLLLGVSVFFIAGCNQVHTSRSARAGAPGLQGETASLRNVANPNAPFIEPAAGPRLAKRDSLLDVNDVLPCQPAQLTMFETRAQSNGPHHTLRMNLANMGEACRLGGFPSISLLGANGRVLADVRISKVSSAGMAASLALPGPRTRDSGEAEGSPSPQLLLPNKGEAEFQMGWTTGPACEQVSRIAVAAPGSVRSILISRPFSICDGQLLLTAVAQPDPQ